MSYVKEILGPGSNLAKQLDHYEIRPSQIKMAEAIDDAIYNKAKSFRPVKAKIDNML